MTKLKTFVSQEFFFFFSSPLFKPNYQKGFNHEKLRSVCAPPIYQENLHRSVVFITEQIHMTIFTQFSVHVKVLTYDGQKTQTVCNMCHRNTVPVGSSVSIFYFIFNSIFLFFIHPFGSQFGSSRARVIRVQSFKEGGKTTEV